MKLDRREFLKEVSRGLALGVLGISQAWADRQLLPNIVLCMADDQGWGDMAYNGHPFIKTPHFDDMAASCLCFHRFYAASPVCSPTRGSVMTGRHPNRFACFSWGHTLRPQEITLAEALRSAGYATGHFGKWHLGSVMEGSPVNPGASGFDEWFSSPNFFDNDPILSREGKAVSTQGESSMIPVNAAIAFMERHRRSKKPFLAVVWFGSPHNPHRASEENRALYKDQPEHLQNFYGEISGMDKAFGRLRQCIEDLGIKENTILWYCSDNGGLKNLGSTGGRGHKGTVYEGGLRVPALLEWPACIQEPMTSILPCVTSDIYPTLLDIVGVRIQHQPKLDGISLYPLIQGKMKKRPQPIGFWHYPAKGIQTPSEEWMAELLEAQKNGRVITEESRLRLNAGDITTQYPEDTFPGHAAWLEWPWKLHRIQETDEEPYFELYDLDNDPQETENRMAKEESRARRMKSSQERWLVSVVRSLNGKDYTNRDLQIR